MSALLKWTFLSLGLGVVAVLWREFDDWRDRRRARRAKLATLTARVNQKPEPPRSTFDELAAARRRERELQLSQHLEAVETETARSAGEPRTAIPVIHARFDKRTLN
jgi:hypothetical protein